MEWTEAETIQAVTKIKRIVILITKSMTIALDVVSMQDACYSKYNPLLQSVTVNLFEEVLVTMTGNCIFSLFAVNLDWEQVPTSLDIVGASDNTELQ